jgi:hypothetical protein
MKKCVWKSVVGFVVFGVLFATGCASTPPASAAPAGVAADVPGFVLRPPKTEGVLYGVGTAKMNTTSLSMTMAENRARVNISQQLSSMVKNMIDDYQASTEATAEQKAVGEQFAQSVSRTLSQAKLTGAEVEERAQMPDGTWYVLVSMNKSNANKEINTAVDREKLNYAEFKNWQAQNQMEAAFAKEQQAEHPPVTRD